MLIFYSGIIHQAIGFPVELYPVLFAIGRTSGWIAQWQKMLLNAEQKDCPATADLSRRRTA